MSKQSAEELLRAHLAETKRRKHVWAAMQVAAQEILAVVLKEARRRKLKGRAWIPNDPEEKFQLLVHIGDAPYIFFVNTSGVLSHNYSDRSDEAYEGYLELPNEALTVTAFRKALLEGLMARLHNHLAGRPESKKQGKR